jgi:hypothetical protein
MKLMQKDPSALDKARKAEQRANEKSGLITIKPVKIEGGAKKGGFKKGGFKSAFAPASGTEEKAITKPEVSANVLAQNHEDSDDELGYEYYDPRQPTGCSGRCGFNSGD